MPFRETTTDNEIDEFINFIIRRVTTAGPHYIEMFPIDPQENRIIYKVINLSEMKIFYPRSDKDETKELEKFELRVLRQMQSYQVVKFVYEKDANGEFGLVQQESNMFNEIKASKYLRDSIKGYIQTGKYECSESQPLYPDANKAILTVSADDKAIQAFISNMFIHTYGLSCAYFNIVPVDSKNVKIEYCISNCGK
jgi:hypothetical protein